MIYKLDSLADLFLEESCREGVKKIEVFFGFKWTRNLPKVFVVKNRKTIDELMGEKTSAWMVAWVTNGIIYLLDRKNFQKESDHKYSNAEYKALIAHEICHIYYAFICGNYRKPVWLNEGVSLYVSGQTGLRKKITKFKEFLDFYDVPSTGEKTVYKEAGFAVQLLVEKYGKGKLIDLIKKSKDYPDKKRFEKLFEEIYGFKLSYKI